jgi:abequosyltransferase
MQNSPLITIAIPTFNRASLLRRLLDQLTQQIGGNTRVELLISDNASTDSTFSTVQEFQHRGLPLRYLRNSENTGADRNIVQCFEQSLGEYVWVFSDDDLMAPGTVGRILDTLSADSYDLVFVTPYFFQGEFEGHRPFRKKADVALTRAPDFVRRVHVLLTFVSALIINKNTVLKTPHPPFESIFGTSLAQLGPTFTALNGHRKSLVIRDPLIAATANTRVGYPLYEVFGANLSKVAHDWLNDAKARDELFKGTLQRFLPFWIFRSRKQSASVVPEDPHEVLRSCFGEYLIYWIFDYPICALPLPLASVWINFVRAVNKVETLWRPAA